MDVTARKEAEAAAEQSRNEQLRFKDEFLSHVSHELRSPLTAIKQFTTILLGGLAGDLNKEQHEYQQIVLKNVCQLQSMIGDILEVTRLETGKLTIEPDSVSVSAAVTDTVNTFQITARAKGIALSCHVPPDLPSAHADQTRLRQMLIILVENAIKFTEGGGAVSIQVGLSPDDPRFLLVEVSDTGCGVSAEMSERIFERLYQAPEPTQASRKGLGLGLYICKELVTRQGGRIWVTRGTHARKHVFLHATRLVSEPRDCAAPQERSVAGGIGGSRRRRGVLGGGLALDNRSRGMVQGGPRPRPTLSVAGSGRALADHARRCEERTLLCRGLYGQGQGASSLANRIRKQSQRSTGLEAPGVTLSVSYRMLEPVRTDGGPSVDHIVSSMATHLEEAMAMSTHSEVILR